MIQVVIRNNDIEIQRHLSYGNAIKYSSRTSSGMVKVGRTMTVLS